MEAATSVGGPEVPRALARGTFGVQGRGYVVVGVWRVLGFLSVFAGGCLPPVLHPTGGNTAHLARCVAKSTNSRRLGWISLDFGCGGGISSISAGSVMGDMSHCTATVAVHADMGRPSDYRSGLVYR